MHRIITGLLSMPNIGCEYILHIGELERPGHLGSISPVGSHHQRLKELFKTANNGRGSQTRHRYRKHHQQVTGVDRPSL